MKCVYCEEAIKRNHVIYLKKDKAYHNNCNCPSDGSIALMNKVNRTDIKEAFGNCNK